MTRPVLLRRPGNSHVPVAAISSPMEKGPVVHILGSAVPRISATVVPVLQNGKIDYPTLLNTTNLIATTYVHPESGMPLPWAYVTGKSYSSGMEETPLGYPVESPDGSLWYVSVNRPSKWLYSRPVLATGLGISINISKDDTTVGIEAYMDSMTGPWTPMVKLGYESSLVTIQKVGQALRIEHDESVASIDPTSYMTLGDLCNGIQELSGGLVKANPIVSPLSRVSPITSFDSSTGEVYMRSIILMSGNSSVQPAYKNGVLTVEYPDYNRLDALLYSWGRFSVQRVDSLTYKTNFNIHPSVWSRYPAIVDYDGVPHPATLLDSNTMKIDSAINGSSYGIGYINGLSYKYSGYVSPEDGSYKTLAPLGENSSLVFALPSHEVSGDYLVRTTCPVRHAVVTPGSDETVMQSVMDGSHPACHTVFSSSGTPGVPIALIGPSYPAGIESDARRLSTPENPQSIRNREDLTDIGYWEGRLIPTAHSNIIFRQSGSIPEADPIKEAQQILPFGSFSTEVVINELG